MKMHSDNLPMEDTGILNQDNRYNMPDSMNRNPGEVPGNGKLINGSPAPSLQKREPISHIAGKAPDSMNRSPGEVPGNGKLINGSPAPSLQKREPISHIAGKAPDSMNLKPGEVPGNGKLINGLPTPSLPTQEPINHITGKAPDPETLEKPTRRRYTAQFKKRILEELDSLTKPGQKGALLRREGLYSSTVANWRKQRDEGNLASLRPQKRGPKSCKNPSEQKQIKELERENRKLRKKLDRANLLLDIQKKISQLTGIPLTVTENEEEDF